MNQMQLRNESPDSALASATGANETARESFLTTEYSACLPPLTSLVYDRGAGWIERPEPARREGWA